MPNDTYGANTTKNSGSLTYDPITKKWVKQSGNTTVSSSSKAPISTGSSSSTVATPASTSNSSSSSTKVTTQADTQTQADKEFIEIEYNTLKGDMSVVPTPEIMKLKVNQTVNTTGFGKYLSGLYYVSGIKRSVSSNGISITLTLIKTGFGDSLKDQNNIQTENVNTENRPQEVQKEITSISVSDRVKVVGEDAIYAGAHEGKKVPDWVKNEIYTVSKVSSDNTTALLKEITSWVYIKYLKKV